METLKRIAKKWNALENDVERWKYLSTNKNEITLMLDNDGTYARFCEDTIPDEIDDWDDLLYLKDFDDWVGNEPGLKALFLILGIDAEGV